MWWGENLSRQDQFEIPHAGTGHGKTFSLNGSYFEELEDDMSLLHEMESASVVKAPRCRLREIESPKTELPALPASSSDPLEAFETVGKPIGTYIDDYWSASASFWSKWKSDKHQ
jgi:hypothetical protein